ncbi:flagellar hook-associated protein FlgK [Lacrimispora celerecrescens]|uniref:flagellar hook-associated protein FlgK n=1 Tax=Lacrimispora celerecrescens TaxID=29354 RepID=UPI00056E4130|nr:flagellar basal body rod C-terminal domain-containing protein [Lacrimispora celerecrescens]
MTRSTFSGFTIAQLAMTASQRAIDVTGQNIANINTKGYTRQRVDLASFNTRGADSMSTGPGSKIGYGVEITGISQIRDPFLDVQFRNQIAKVGTADARQTTLDQLADIFDETDKEALKKALSDLSSSLDQLSANANNSEFDSIVRSRAQVIVNYIHQKAADLKSVREETINGLENTDIPAINGLLSDIGELNDAIWKSQVQGNPALELLDKRNDKLDELAGYLPISVTYKDVVVSNGTKYDYPVVSFRGSDGVTYPLTAGEHGENVASISMKRNKGFNGEPDGKVSISLIPASDFPSDADVSSLETNITDYLKEGTLKGTVDVLNKSGEMDNPSSDYRGIGYYEKSFEAFVQTFANTLNELNGNMQPYTGVTQLPTIGTASKDSKTNEAVFSMDYSKATGNFLRGEKITVNGKTYTFGDGTGTDEIAIGDTLEKSLQNLADELNSSPSMLVDGNEVPGKWSYASGKLEWRSNGAVTTAVDSIQTTDKKDISVVYKANPLNIKNFDLFQTSDGSNRFTASNIKISDDWMNNSIHIISSHKEDAGSTANDNIIKMLKSLTDERVFKYEYTYMDTNGVAQTGYITHYTGNFSQCYSNLENTQGIDSSANQAILNNHISVLQQTADSKDAVSGVSLDDEGISLMQYQRSFSAAARLMTTLDEALNTLINNTGIVGR